MRLLAAAALLTHPSAPLQTVGIVGAGPAGLTLAVALNRALPDVAVTIFDRSDSCRPALGGGVQLNSGAAVLARLDPALGAAVAKLGQRVRRVRSRTAGGDGLLDLDLTAAIRGDARARERGLVDADDDAFDKAVKGCWKLEAATKPYVAPPRKQRPPPIIKVAWPPTVPDEEEEEVSNMPVGRWNDEDDAYEGLESRVTMGMLEELRMLTYEPVCDATEFRRRLGGPPDVIGLEDLARRLRRRAASADLAVSARKAARLSVVAVEFAGGDTSMRCDDFHRELAVLFGRDRDTILQTRRPLSNAPSSSLRKALEGVDQNALMEADQFIELFDKAHIGCQARHVRAAVARACRAAGLPQPRGALGERDWASPHALLELCRGGPLNARRSKLVSRAFDLLEKRLGEPMTASKLAALLPGAPISAKPAPPARQAFLEAVGGARARVSVDTFRAVFEDLSSGVEGDFAFAKLLANCWDVAPWPAAADSVEEEEFPEFDPDDDVDSRRRSPRPDH